MRFQVPTKQFHPLKQAISKKGLRLWQVCVLLDNKVSEPQLSRMLNGIENLPVELEKNLLKIISQV